MGAFPEAAHARPVAGLTVRDPFRLGALSTSRIAINRVNYGVTSKGEIGVDETGRGTQPGGSWPRGTNDGYMFNSGIQVTGVIAGVKSTANPWGGDTTGAKFFDPIGTETHTEEVTQAVRNFDPVDVANWPEVALVPDGDEGAELFDPLLRGKMAASQGDLHFIAWDGNPALVRNRPHPLGILIEHRLMQWNYPSGNEDIMYLVATAYNITSTNAADYEAHRPSMRTILLAKAAEFQTLNEAAYGIDLPNDGYTIDPFYMAWASDPDVGQANRNSSGVNLPFALGYTFVPDFVSASGFIYPPEVFSSPFFPGPGFFGAKYLKSPQGPGAITLFSNNVNGVTGVGDPSPAQTLYRWMKGDPPGANTCNVPDPLINHVCFISLKPTTANTPLDVRMMQSASAATLAPGQSASVVIAYIHAAPVKLDGYTPAVNQWDNQMYQPARRTLLTNTPESLVAVGAHRVDSLTGFRAYVGAVWDHFTNDEGEPDSSRHVPLQSEFKAVPGSLLDKASVAQLIFDNKFLLPFAPANPEFFLIPGDKRVTVLWRPSASEVEGDAYAAVARSPFLANGVDPNNLYDPNFREKDVEGYRVYRGRLDNPTSLQLLTQFDFSGTNIRDFGGNISRGLHPECAPELHQFSSTVCPRVFPDNGITPGVTANAFFEYDLTGTIVQTLYGQRVLLQSGKVFTLAADTLMTGAYYISMRGAGGVGYPALSNTGVPYTFVDEAGACSSCGVINGVNYFYAVTAFDVNSLRSGPPSLESVRTTKQVTPGSIAANFNNTFTAQAQVIGRSVRTDQSLPTLDPSTGRFSKAFPASNAVSIKLATFIPQLLKGSGAITMKLDSIGTPSLTASTTAATSAATYYYDITPATGNSFKVSSSQTITLAGTTGNTGITTDSTSSGAPFTAMTFDPALVSVYGGTAEGYAVNASWTVRRLRGYYTSSWGQGCARTTSTTTFYPGFYFNQFAKCFYNGPRWYTGANETMNDPTGQNPWVNNPALVPMANRRYSNAGQLPGVVTAHFPASYAMLSGGASNQGLGWQAVETALSHFVTAADYSVYWGAGGVIDSVIDLTHDVVVPFRSDMNASWGVLNSNSVPQAQRWSRRDVLTVTDVSCVWPLKSYQAVNRGRTAGFQFDSLSAAGDVLGIPCQSALATNAAQATPLVTTVVPGPIAFFNDTLNRVKRPDAAPVAANNGFLFYVKGRIFLFELAGGQVPAAGTQWKLRDYVGVISGGKGDAGDLGAYRFYTTPLPFTAVGAAAQFKFDVSNVVEKPTAAAMAKIRTVPDPYYVTSAYDLSVTGKTIKFLNVPSGAKVRIYSPAGILVTELVNTRAANDGTVLWNVRNRSNQFVASGPYFWVVEIDGVKQTGRMVVVNNAQNVN